MGHSTERIPISLEGPELAEKAQDNSLVLNYLLSFSPWKWSEAAWIKHAYCYRILYTKCKVTQMLKYFGPIWVFLFSLKKKKKNHCFLHFAFSVPALKVVSSVTTSPETGSGQADILISQVWSISLLSINFTYLPLTLKGLYFQLEN